MKYCIIIPCKNEEKNIPLIYNQLNKILIKTNFDIFFIDDGSDDSTWLTISKLSKLNKNIKGIKLRKSFGKNMAILSAIENINLNNYNAFLFMDADLQHPPIIAKKMILEFSRNKYEIIYSHRNKFKTSFLRSIFSKFYYFIVKYLFSLNFDEFNTDFFIASTKVVNNFLSYNEMNINFKSILLDLNIKNRKRIEFDAPDRNLGKSSFSFSNLSSLALQSITYNTYIPTKFIIFIGLILIISFLIIIFYMFSTQYLLGLFTYKLISYFIVYNSLLISVIIFLIGIIGLYVGNIQQEILKRPRYLIEKKT